MFPSSPNPLFRPHQQLLLLLVLFLPNLLAFGPLESCYDTFRCTQAQCSGDCVQCVANGEDTGAECNGIKINLFASDSDFCDCCPGICIPYLEEGAPCNEQASPNSIEGVCGPQLTCTKSPDSAGSVCTWMNAPCTLALRQYENDLEAGTLGIDQHPPDCDDEGMFKPKQCLSSGTCRCVAKDTGVPIFGLETNMTAAENMTCACASQVWELKAHGCAMLVNYDGAGSDGSGTAGRARFKQEYEDCLKKPEQYFPKHLRCQPNGNFDTAQCIEQTKLGHYQAGYTDDQCFCYDESWQKPGDFDSTIVPLNVAGFVLECHREGEADLSRSDLGVGHFPDGYYRPCEKLHIEQRKLEDFYKAEGSTYFSTEVLPVCGPDGYHALVQPDPENPEKGFCSDLLGNKLEEFGGTYDKMNCQCALVRDRVQEWGEKPACTSDGSYQLRQCLSGKCFCVDKFGTQCAKETPSSEPGCCLTPENQLSEPYCPPTGPEIPAFESCPKTVRDLITTTTTTITPPTTNNPDGPTPDPSNPCASTCAGKAAGFYAPECCATTNICLCFGNGGGKSCDCPAGYAFCDARDWDHQTLCQPSKGATDCETLIDGGPAITGVCSILDDEFCVDDCCGGDADNMDPCDL